MSIVDVAKAAGVSTATVSRVMNDLPGVRRETVALVRAAVDELNYTPRRSRARSAVSAGDAKPRRRRRRRRVPSLASDVGLRTGNIGVVTVGHSPSWLERPVLAKAFGGIQRGVGELGLRLMLEEMRDPARPTDAMLRGQLDGVVAFISSDLSGAAVTQALGSIRSRLPCVWAMGTSVAPDLVDHVTIDNVAVGHLAAGHLLSKGCRRLAFVADAAAWPLVRLRGQAFLNRARDEHADSAVAYLAGADAITAAGYGADTVVARDLNALVARLAAARGRRRGAGGRLGLFVYNDHATSQVHPLLARHGLRLGEDVELVSCDAEQARLDAMHPRPPSIDPGAAEIGFRAVVRLLARIQRPSDPLLTIHVAPRL